MERRGFATALVATWVAALARPVSAQLGIANPSEPPNPIPDETELALGDAQARLTVAVAIDGRGPWPFIIDTGAERTVLSHELAGILGLGAGPRARIVTLAGIAVRDSVIVPRLTIGRVEQRDVVTPVLQAHDLGALGMLGVDSLQDNRVTIDFRRNTMTVARSTRHRPANPIMRTDEIVVTARSLFGRLIVTDARWRTHPIAVVVDTGAPTSIGNPALRALAAPSSRSIGTLSGVSAIGQPYVADAYAVDALQVGGVGFANVPIGFTDGPAFHRLGLVERPALLLGMDAMRLFRRVDIDFANRRIAFSLDPAHVAGPAPGD